MSMLKTGTGATLVRTGASVALALSALVAVASSSQAVVAPITPSTAMGVAGGGNTVTLTIPTTASPKFTSAAVGVQFVKDAAPATSTCPTTAVTPSDTTHITAATVKFLSTTKVGVVVPDLSGAGGTAFMICAYNAAASGGNITSTTVIGKGVYNVGSPTGTATISPSSGPSLGGQTVTITATGLPGTIATATPLTASIGGVPLTNITLGASGTFTGVTGARVAGANLDVSVTTVGGTTKTNSLYEYKNAISVLPNTVASNTSVDIDVLGVGFNAITFDATSNGTDSPAVASGQVGTNSASGHVYLVQGVDAVYDPSGLDATNNKGNGQKSECVNVAVISDSELICTVNAAKKITATAGAYAYATSPLPNGTYTVTVVNSGRAAAPTFQTVVSSGSTFTVADF